MNILSFFQKKKTEKKHNGRDCVILGFAVCSTECSIGYISLNSWLIAKYRCVPASCDRSRGRSTEARGRLRFPETRPEGEGAKANQRRD